MFDWLKYFGLYPPAVFPLPRLPDGREGVVTSTAGEVAGGPNGSRPDHAGDDWFYPRADSDDEPTGDGGGTSNMKWNVPDGSVAVAVADGRVMERPYGRISSGHRLWIDHGNGIRTGYFHLSQLLAGAGQRVRAGQPIGVVGDNPNAVDARHLHLEVSPVDRYAPQNPSAYLAAIGAVHAPVRSGFSMLVLAAIGATVLAMAVT